MAFVESTTLYMTLASECGRGRYSYIFAFLSLMLNDCIGFSVITRNYSEQQEASFIMADESEKKNGREFQHITLCCVVILKFHSLAQYTC